MFNHQWALLQKNPWSVYVVFRLSSEPTEDPLATWSFLDWGSCECGDKLINGEKQRKQRLVGRPGLDELFSDISDKPQRNRAIKKAHLEYGYTLKELADQIGRHYSPVSRVVSG